MFWFAWFGFDCLNQLPLNYTAKAHLTNFFSSGLVAGVNGMHQMKNSSLRQQQQKTCKSMFFCWVCDFLKQAHELTVQKIWYYNNYWDTSYFSHLQLNFVILWCFPTEVGKVTSFIVTSLWFFVEDKVHHRFLRTVLQKISIWQETNDIFCFCFLLDLLWLL